MEDNPTFLTLKSRMACQSRLSGSWSQSRKLRRRRRNSEAYRGGSVATPAHAALRDALPATLMDAWSGRNPPTLQFAHHAMKLKARQREAPRAALRSGSSPASRVSRLSRGVRHVRGFKHSFPVENPEGGMKFIGVGGFGLVEPERPVGRTRRRCSRGFPRC
jgi:hypothetical protein